MNLIREVTKGRRYLSPKRQAQAAATREAILAAFVAQLSEPGRHTLSPSEAARWAGVSLRTVHAYFPNHESQIIALGAWFDLQFHPDGVLVAQGPLGVWKEVRRQRRSLRLEAIRRAVKDIGAPARATEDVTALLLSLSGADACWPLHDAYGLPLARIPEVIANAVRLIVEDLRSQVRGARR